MMGHSMISLCFKPNLHAAVRSLRLAPSAPCGGWDHAKLISCLKPVAVSAAARLLATTVFGRLLTGLPKTALLYALRENAPSPFQAEPTTMPLSKCYRRVPKGHLSGLIPKQQPPAHEFSEKLLQEDDKILNNRLSLLPVCTSNQRQMEGGKCCLICGKRCDNYERRWESQPRR